MILRLETWKNVERGGGKEITDIYESDCGNVFLKNGRLNAATCNLFSFGIYNMVHGMAHGFEVVEVKK